jgi:ubiquinone/menaquinone biosynthesis C-methylase UbiE
MSLPRKVEPELLDQLPADDPRAIRSRRDLKLINALAFHAGLMARGLIRHYGDDKPRTLVDLGAGDGTFMLGVAHRLASRWPNVNVILLDRQSIVSGETRAAFAALGWKVETVAADLFDFFEGSGPVAVDIITANLFLHHFTPQQLARLFTRVAQAARLFIACDPRRTAWVREISRLGWAIGCNDVSVHDAVASARAGFSGKELSALWPSAENWELHERAAGLLSHCFVARRAAITGPIARAGTRASEQGRQGA